MVRVVRLVLTSIALVGVKVTERGSRLTGVIGSLRL
jgi:hypothetical protein